VKNEKNRQFCDGEIRSAAVLTLGLGNEYFCRPQPLKEAKMCIPVSTDMYGSTTVILKPK
jgi:hypothetical protein